MKSYLTFSWLRETGKTSVWAVHSTRSGDRLGLIRWFGRWRQYTLEPIDGTVWNKDCLREIADFLEQEMVARR